MTFYLIDIVESVRIGSEIKYYVQNLSYALILETMPSVKKMMTILFCTIIYFLIWSKAFSAGTFPDFPLSLL